MKSRFKNSFLIVLIIALSLWLSAFTIKGNTDTSLPSHGYRLIIDNDGGKVFDDGIEVQSGYIKELREAEQEGKLLACPDDGFVVQTWYLIRLDNDKFTELGKQNLCQFGVYSGFVEIHVSFEQK